MAGTRMAAAAGVMLVGAGNGADETRTRVNGVNGLNVCVSGRGGVNGEHEFAKRRIHSFFFSCCHPSPGHGHDVGQEALLLVADAIPAHGKHWFVSKCL